MTAAPDRVPSGTPPTPQPIRRVSDLLSPEERDSLRADLREIAECRRRSAASAGQVWL